MIMLMKNTIIRRKNIRQDSRTEVSLKREHFIKMLYSYEELKEASYENDEPDEEYIPNI